MPCHNTLSSNSWQGISFLHAQLDPPCCMWKQPFPTVVPLQALMFLCATLLMLPINVTDSHVTGCLVVLQTSWLVGFVAEHVFFRHELLATWDACMMITVWGQWVICCPQCCEGSEVTHCPQTDAGDHEVTWMAFNLRCLHVDHCLRAMSDLLSSADCEGNEVTHCPQTDAGDHEVTWMVFNLRCLHVDHCLRAMSDLLSSADCEGNEVTHCPQTDAGDHEVTWMVFNLRCLHVDHCLRAMSDLLSSADCEGKFCVKLLITVCEIVVFSRCRRPRSHMLATSDVGNDLWAYKLCL